MIRVGACPWESLETLAFCSNSDRLLIDWSQVVMVPLVRSCEDPKKIETDSMPSLVYSFRIGLDKHNMICLAAPQVLRFSPRLRCDDVLEHPELVATGRENGGFTSRI